MIRRRSGAAVTVLLAALLAGCSQTPRAPTPAESVRDDGGPARPSAAVLATPDAVPQDEPPSRYGNPPEYEVFGETYTVMDEAGEGFEQTGYASWYGTKFHGRRTSSGETYDMYAMTAAHRELPLPTWVEVTNLENDQSVVVKVNDRGPFVDTGRRIIDLSYAAAARLDMADQGTARVHIRRVTADGDEPDEPAVDLHQAALPPAPEGDVDPDAETESERETETADPAAGADPQPAGAPEGDLAAAGPTIPPVPLTPEPLPESAETGAADAAGRTDEDGVEVDTADPVISASGGISPVHLYLQVGAFSERSNAERLLERLRSELDDGAEPRIDERQRDDTALYRVHLGPLENVTEADRLGEELEALGLESVLISP